MRLYAAFPLLCLTLGCRHAWDGPGLCGQSGPCTAESAPSCPAPCPPERKAAVAYPQPDVEIHPPPEVHVRAPAPKVIVDMPAQTLAAPAPQFASAPQFAPAQPQAVTMMAAGGVPQSAPNPAALGTTTQTIRPSRTQYALGLRRGEIRIPFPRLRLVPFNTPAEVSTTTEFETVTTTTTIPASVQTFSPQSFAQQTQTQLSAAVVSQPTVLVQQAAAANVQPLMAVQSAAVAQPTMVLQPTTMAVQTLAAPQPQPQTQFVYQTVAAPQTLAAPQPATTQLVVAAPQPLAAQQTLAAPQAAVCPTPSQETLQRLQQELDATRALINTRSK